MTEELKNAEQEVSEQNVEATTSTLDSSEAQDSVAGGNGGTDDAEETPGGGFGGDIGNETGSDTEGEGSGKAAI